MLAVAFSPDGKHLAACGYDGKVWLWEVESANKVFEVSPPPPAPSKTAAVLPTFLQALAFSSDGKKLAVGASDGRLHEFEASGPGKHLRAYQGHTSSVTGLAYHPGGNLLISVSKDRTLRLWNTQSGGPYKSLEGHAAWIEGVTLAEKGTVALTISADRSLRLWDLGAQPQAKKK